MSVWTDIGMREGMFYGVVPEFFLRNAFSFFSLLRNQCRKSVDPDHAVPAWEKRMDFFARAKHHGTGRSRVDPYNDYWKYFTYFFIRPDVGSQAPIGAPIPEYLWCEPPKWEKTNFTEAEILGESEIFRHPADRGTAIPRTAPSLDWHKQRYRLIQKGRYCIVPITTNVKYDGEWLNMTTSAGYINDEDFGWWYVRGLKFAFDDFWFQEGVDARIGIYNEHVGGAAVFPFQGAYWFPQKTVTLIPEEDKRWDGYSILRAYGIIDLSTHPDFAEYFDTVSVECPSLPEPPSATPSSSSVVPPPSSSISPSDGSGGGSSGGGGGGGCTLKEAYFRLNSKSRTVGAVSSYVSVEVGTGPDTHPDYYAVSWDGYKGTKLYKSISADVYSAACDTWLPDEVDLDDIRRGMQEAAQDIYTTNVNAPWQDGGIYLDGATRVSGDDKADFTIFGKKEYTISQWAFTANPTSHNMSNPGQCFGELTLVSANDGITSVDVKIGDKVFTMAVGDTLGWDELKEFFQYGNLPKPELGDCYPEFVEPSERILWPILYNVNNSTYPWGNMGKSQSLKIEIVDYSCKQTKSVEANKSTENNAYTNALPEDLK